MYRLLVYMTCHCYHCQHLQTSLVWLHAHTTCQDSRCCWDLQRLGVAQNGPQQNLVVQAQLTSELDSSAQLYRMMAAAMQIVQDTIQALDRPWVSPANVSQMCPDAHPMHSLTRKGPSGPSTNRPHHHGR